MLSPGATGGWEDAVVKPPPRVPQRPSSAASLVGLPLATVHDDEDDMEEAPLPQLLVSSSSSHGGGAPGSLPSHTHMEEAPLPASRSHSPLLLLRSHAPRVGARRNNMVRYDSSGSFSSTASVARARSFVRVRRHPPRETHGAVLSDRTHAAVGYSDEKVANRDIGVWHLVIEDGY